MPESAPLKLSAAQSSVASRHWQEVEGAAPFIYRYYNLSYLICTQHNIAYTISI